MNDVPSQPSHPPLSLSPPHAPQKATSQALSTTKVGASLRHNMTAPFAPHAAPAALLPVHLHPRLPLHLIFPSTHTQLAQK